MVHGLIRTKVVINSFIVITSILNIACYHSNYYSYKIVIRATILGLHYEGFIPVYHSFDTAKLSITLYFENAFFSEGSKSIQWVVKNQEDSQIRAENTSYLSLSMSCTGLLSLARGLKYELLGSMRFSSTDFKLWYLICP